MGASIGGDEVNVEVKHLGCAGHFICARNCLWKRHTEVGNYRISTVGNLFYEHRKERITLGCDDDSFFETMVFKLTGEYDPSGEGCGCRQVESWSELECERYATAGEAQAGHEKWIERYKAIAEGE